MPTRRVPLKAIDQSRMRDQETTAEEVQAPLKSLDIDDFAASPWIGLHFRHEMLLHHRHELIGAASQGVTWKARLPSQAKRRCNSTIPWWQACLKPGKRS